MRAKYATAVPARRLEGWQTAESFRINSLHFIRAEQCDGSLLHFWWRGYYNCVDVNIVVGKEVSFVDFAGSDSICVPPR